jgi:molybdopterin-guanine dinucleotide biosynthesis protein A
MGRDKASIFVSGEPLWRRQARVLRKAGATRVALVLRPGQSVPPDTDKLAVQVLRDDHVDSGPIAGLHAAITAPPLAHWYLVLAVDLPKIEPDWFGWLSGFCDDGVGAIASHDTGYEPLAAIYPVAAGPVIAGQIERGEYSLQYLADCLVQTGRLRAIPLPARRLTQLVNWNTPADMDEKELAPACKTPGAVDAATMRGGRCAVSAAQPFGGAPDRAADLRPQPKTSWSTDPVGLQPHFDKRMHP